MRLGLTSIQVFHQQMKTGSAISPRISDLTDTHDENHYTVLRCSIMMNPKTLQEKFPFRCPQKNWPLEFTGKYMCVWLYDCEWLWECVWSVIVFNQNVLGSKCLWYLSYVINARFLSSPCNQLPNTNISKFIYKRCFSLFYHQWHKGCYFT